MLSSIALLLNVLILFELRNTELDFGLGLVELWWSLGESPYRLGIVSRYDAGSVQ